MFEHSEQINELADALSKAQGEIEGAKKSTTNSFFKSKYADLHEVLSVAKEPLANHGLSVVQIPHDTEGAISMSTVIMHKSGQWMTGPSLTARPVKNDPQGIGSVVSYLRRYTYSAFVGVAQMDDDGNEATRRPATQPASKMPATEPAPKLPPYPGEEFAANAVKWGAIFESGKRTAQDVINAIKTQYTLTPDQESAIKGLGVIEQ